MVFYVASVLFNAEIWRIDVEHSQYMLGIPVALSIYLELQRSLPGRLPSDLFLIFR